MMHLWSQLAQLTDTFTTELDFSYTLVKAKSCFSWGPLKVMVSKSVVLAGILTNTTVSRQYFINIIAAHLCWDF